MARDWNRCRLCHFVSRRKFRCCCQARKEMGPKEYARWVQDDIEDEASMWGAMRVPEVSARRAA